MKKQKKQIPSVEALEAELGRTRHRENYRRVLRSTFFSLVVVAAIAVLVATLWMPVLQIYGSSMTPTLDEGQFVVSVKSSQFETGDLLAFYLGNKLLVKRCIAGPGDWVDIDEAGNVSVNDVPLDEPYLTEKAFGECDIELPYQVPDERWFLMGDHRSTSVDSRNSTVGCASKEQIVGRIIFRVWPLSEFGRVG
ncbi:MAG: signal peptidase I [Ruminococcaceae bacterium]|nr:signal peptidase I [Oscillospiraceae bacterium]